MSRSFMNNKQILYHLLTFFVLAVSNAGMAANWVPDKNLIIRGSNNYAPFEYLNSRGEPEGFNIDIIKALMEELEYTNYNLKLENWDTIYNNLKNNKIDIIIGIMYSPHRNKDVKFSLPLCQVSNSIIGRKGSTAKDYEDLAWKEVIVQTNSANHHTLLNNKLTDKIIAVHSITEAIQMLSQGKGDAMMENELTAYYYIKHLRIKNLVVRNMPLKPLAYCIAVNADNDNLLYQLNLGIQALKTNGKYDEIYNRWFGVIENNRYGKTFITISIILVGLLLLLLLFLWILRKQVKRATRLLFNSKQEIEMAIDAGKISVWSYNITTHILSTLHGKIIYDGFTLEKMVTHLHPDDRKAVSDAFGDLAEGIKKRMSVCFRIQGETGGEYFTHEVIMIRVEKSAGFPSKIIGTRKDVTEEIALKKQLEDYRLKTNIITETNDIIFIQYDLITQTFIKVNKLGKEDKDHYTKSEYMALVHPQDINLANTFIASMEAHQQERICSEYRLLSESKQYEWYTIDTIAYKHNKAGEITSYLGIRRNNNKWKQITDDLITLRDKAEASNKLKSAFLANMSHEIRTPLNAIVGFSDLMADTDSEQDKQQYKGIIKTNSELLLQLIDDILDLSRIEAGLIDIHHKSFNFGEYLNDLYAALLLRKPATIDFILKRHDKNLNIIINSDKTRISQIITNLVTNAFKFTQQGNVTLECNYENKLLIIYITDTGIGISPENQEKIFDRFEKLDNFAQGTGLGLSICKALTKAMDGEISVESKLGKGTCFKITLPCKTE
ncbi:MAG: transporter substrate-binding domain-containing protein [Bacteroidales bacterium]